MQLQIAAFIWRIERKRFRLISNYFSHMFFQRLEFLICFSLTWFGRIKVRVCVRFMVKYELLLLTHSITENERQWTGRSLCRRIRLAIGHQRAVTVHG